jgi:5-methylcytosine-specific restriction endonuclease McrA
MAPLWLILGDFFPNYLVTLTANHAHYVQQGSLSQTNAEATYTNIKSLLMNGHNKRHYNLFSRKNVFLL